MKQGEGELYGCPYCDTKLNHVDEELDGVLLETVVCPECTREYLVTWAQIRWKEIQS